MLVPRLIQPDHTDPRREQEGDPVTRIPFSSRPALLGGLALLSLFTLSLSACNRGPGEAGEL
ncbi:MAG: hypothetical protein WED81_06760, partial [Rhodothermales bacterium]